jgi:hypothetical protein
MKNFSSISAHSSFRKYALPALKAAVSGFFGCDVTFVMAPLEWAADKYSIDISSTPRRGFYPVNDSTAIVLGRVIENRKPIACFALELTNGNFAFKAPLLQTFEGVLTHLTSSGFRTGYTQGAKDFSESMIVETIGKHFGKGRFGYQQVVQFVEMFQRLSNTQFEGDNFSTGLILTRSPTAFDSKRPDGRSGGTVMLLDNPVPMSLGTEIKKRFWYLADGRTSYFLCVGRSGKTPLIVGQFFLNPEFAHGDPYLDTYTLSRTLRGSDALFRVMSIGEASVVGGDGLELLYKEGAWRARSLVDFRNVMQNFASVPSKVADALISIVLRVSQSRRSALIWITEDESARDSLLLTRNRLHKTSMSLLEPSHRSTITRFVTSDGAVVITPQGSVEYYGCIVDITNLETSGVSGTGESVGQILGKHGVAVKISQDGNIKVFYGERKQIL